MREHIVGNGDKGVFLDKEFAILHDNGKPVHIGVDDKAHICPTLAHQVADGGQILGNGLRRVAKVAGGFTVQFLNLVDAKGLQQLRDRDAAHRIDGIDGYGEVPLADGFDIHQVKRQHLVDVAPQPGVILLLTAQVIDVGIVKIFGLGQSEHLLALGIGEKFAVVIEQFQGIPLLGIVRRRDDDAATSLLAHNGQLGGRRSRQADVDHIKAHARERADNGIEHHAPRQARIAANDDDVGLDGRIATHKRGISRGELDDIQRGQAITRGTTDGATDA